jgi:Ca-activated chloride channel family protein
MSFAQRQKQPEVRLLFLLDASFSMYEKMDNTTRIDVAKRLLTKLVDSLSKIDGVELGLRIYGHQNYKTKRDCKDTKLEIPFSPNNHFDIKQRILNLKPMGTTPIAYSLTQAAYDFPAKDGVKNIVILITDGIEECGGDPCAVSEALREQGVTLRPFVIGVGLNADFRAQFECVGRYFDAETENDFSNVLNLVINQAINNTTVQLNLLDIYSNPKETDVGVTMLDANTGREIYHFIHTIDARGNPDTIFVDPLYEYDILVHTLPPVMKKGVKVTAGTHNIIGIDAPQGYLRFDVDGNKKNDNIQVVVYKKDSREIVNVQNFNTSQKYIVGEYDIEILTLPRISQGGVKVSQNKTTSLKISEPGELNLITRVDIVGGIFRVYKGKKELVKSLNIKREQNFIKLQPGTYTLTYRKSSDRQTDRVKTLTFIITSARSHYIEIK